MQRILEGISALKTALEGSRKVFLVCDGSWQYLNIGPAVEAAITGIGSPVISFSDFGPNPLYESVCKGVELFNSAGCDTIVAVGGGSSIDVAKCIKLFCRMAPGTLFLKQTFRDTGIKLIAIPTTAGTGSESTRYAVAYYKGEKQSITHQSIIPDYAILEPSVLESLPLYQKKCTMMDALCQAIESWWSVNATDASSRLSCQAIQLIISNWQPYIFDCCGDTVPGIRFASLIPPPAEAGGPPVHEVTGDHASPGDSVPAAKAIMKAANLAGQAINITQTTAPHAFSYKLTSLFGLPHGHAVALCLPEIWEFMLDSLSFRPSDSSLSFRPSKASGGISLHATFIDIAHAMGTDSPETAITLFRSLMSQMELGPFSRIYPPKESPFSDRIYPPKGKIMSSPFPDRIYPPKGLKVRVHARLEDISCQEKNALIDTLASSVNPIRLANNPVPISEADARAIYSKILL